MIAKRLFIPIIIFNLVACGQNEKAVISGKIQNAESGQKSYLQEYRINSIRTIDSASIRSSGTFRYKLELPATGMYQLNVGENQSLLLFITPGEKIHITADSEDFYSTKSISGSPASERINILYDSLRAASAQLNRLRSIYDALSDTLPDRKAQEEKLNEEYVRIRKNHYNYSVRYVLEDLRSLTNIAALNQQYSPQEYVFQQTRDLQYFKIVTDTLMKYYPNIRHVRALRSYYQELMSDYNRERLLYSRQPVSYDVPDLKLPSPRGNLIALSSLKGKLVLLTFWSLTQQESIENTLALKKVYDKYRAQGFEIYQVALDKSFENFKRSVAYEEITWISVVDTAFPNSQTRGLFNIEAVPMNYLINRDQTEILAKNLTPEGLERSIQYLSANPD